MLKKQINAIDRVMCNGDGKFNGFFVYNKKEYVFNNYMVVCAGENINPTKEVCSNKNIVDTLNRYMENARQNKYTLVLPTVKKLKEEIKERGCRRNSYGKPFGYMAENKVERFVNPHYILDIYESLNIGKDAVIAYVSKSWNSPIYIRTENGEAVLMPCRPPKNN